MEVRLRGRPTLETLALLVAVFAVQSLLRVLAPPLAAGLFVLYDPGAQPWALATSVYAHGGPGHLLTNAVGLVLFGLAVERVTTRWRFHAFFLTVGALSGVGQVLWSAAFSTGGGVLGASGAVLGLLGYLVGGNAVSEAAVGRLDLSVRQQAVVFGLVAVGVTWATAGPGVAVGGHFVGLALGLVAGRLRLLHAAPDAGGTDADAAAEPTGPE
jgi:membrane associated rhomboid family serine protease